MIRRIVKIDREKCTGCGLCASACHEGAIDMVNGKACLARESFCDGFGDCLPACPADAITFEEREAPAYDEAAVTASRREKARSLEEAPVLQNWPIQVKLAPLRSGAYEGADLLIAADCTAYAYGHFRERFMDGRVTLIACPKLDGVDYSDKLTGLFAVNDIASVTLTRMEVPCCGGLELAVKRAIAASGKDIPLQVVTIGINGKIKGEGTF